VRTAGSENGRDRAGQYVKVNEVRRPEDPSRNRESRTEGRDKTGKENQRKRQQNPQNPERKGFQKVVKGRFRNSHILPGKGPGLNVSAEGDENEQKEDSGLSRIGFKKPDKPLHTFTYGPGK